MRYFPLHHNSWTKRPLEILNTTAFALPVCNAAESKSASRQRHAIRTRWWSPLVWIFAPLLIYLALIPDIAQNLVATKVVSPRAA